LDEFAPRDADIWNAQRWLKPWYQYQKLGESQRKTWSIMESGIDGDTYVLGVNMNIIRREGVEHPGTLADRGQWNWDKFLEICRAVTRSTTGEGFINQWGICGLPEYIVQYAIASNDGTLTTVVGNRYEPNLRDPKTMAALRFCEILFDPTFPLWQSPDIAGGTTFGNWGWNFEVAWTLGQAAFFQNNIEWGFGGPSTEDRFEFSVVGFPIGPDNNQHWNAFHGFGGNNVFPRGPGGTEEKTLMYWIFEDWWSWFGDEEHLFWDGQVDFWDRRTMTFEDRDRAISILAEDPHPTKKIEVGILISGYAGNLSSIVQFLYEGSGNLSQAIETYWGTMQDVLDAQVNSRVRLP
jgi:hypothetical protein